MIMMTLPLEFVEPEALISILHMALLVFMRSLLKILIVVILFQSVTSYFMPVIGLFHECWGKIAITLE